MDSNIEFIWQPRRDSNSRRRVQYPLQTYVGHMLDGMNEHNIAIDHVKKFCDPHESLQILHMAICFIHVSSVFSMRLSCLWMSYANPPTIITGMGMNMTPARGSIILR